MKRICYFCAVLGFAGVISGPPIGFAKPKRVVVNASADPDYLERTKDAPYQTYHFLKGNFVPGSKKDKSLEKIGFMEVAETTAEFLKARKFYPAANKEEGDLLIMVSWGSTMLDADFTDLMGVNDLGNAEAGAVPEPEQAIPEGPDDPAPQQPVDYAPPSTEAEGAGAYHTGKNVVMLGFDKGFSSRNTRASEKDRLRQELSRERYFIVLNAFDLPHMRKTNELKEVWSCRYSTNNLGTNFAKAIKFMNVAAAPTFGMNLDELQTPRVDPDASVEKGDLEVIALEPEGEE